MGFVGPGQWYSLLKSESRAKRASVRIFRGVEALEAAWCTVPEFLLVQSLGCRVRI